MPTFLLPDEVDCNDPLVEEAPPINQIIFYQLKKKKQGDIYIYTYEGKQHSTNERLYYPNVELNVFAKYPKEIPLNARKKKFSVERIKSTISDPMKKKIVLLKKKPLGYEKASMYLIHDNGGRPFLVYIQKNRNVAVFTFANHKTKNQYLSYKDWKRYASTSNYWKLYTIKILEFKKVDKIFLGDDPYCDEEEECEDYPCLGNSILLQISISPNKYIFIGESIYSFEFNEEIIKYRSVFAGSDSPSPVAETKTKYLFMLDQIWMSKQGFIITEDRPYDIYYHFYGHGGIKKQKPKEQGNFSKVKILQERL